MKPPLILIVEDEEKINNLIRSYLEKEGYDTKQALTGEEGLRLFSSYSPSLVILDLMLPGIHGEEVCRRIRSMARTPVIMLTAKIEEENLIEGFDLGADDYMTKPFSPKELMVRVRALLRRSAEEQLPLGSRLEFNEGDLIIDCRTREVKCAGRPIKLTPKEYNILMTFVGHPGRIYTREDLINLAMGKDFEGFDRTIDTYIKNLRKKMEKEIKNPVYIRTVHGIGYRFMGDSNG